MTNIKRALDLALSQLTPYSETARIDAETLLAHVLTKNRAYLYAHSDSLLTQAELFKFERLVARRTLGMPVAYLTGMREFWSLPLQVNEETLIPRPETELLVELALSLLTQNQALRVLDLGTGSGAIALALAKEKPEWEIFASDFSPLALETAKENALRLKLDNIYFYLSDWFAQINFPETFHAIVSNPPYIAANDPHLSKGDLRFEPELALVGGETGLTALEYVIKDSVKRLESNGLLLIEHGFDQKSSVRSMLNKYGYQQVQCWQDIHGNDRVSGGWII